MPKKKKMIKPRDRASETMTDDDRVQKSARPSGNKSHIEEDNNNVKADKAQYGFGWLLTLFCCEISISWAEVAAC